MKKKKLLYFDDLIIDTLTLTKIIYFS